MQDTDCFKSSCVQSQRGAVENGCRYKSHRLHLSGRSVSFLQNSEVQHKKRKFKQGKKENGLAFAATAKMGGLLALWALFVVLLAASDADETNTDINNTIALEQLSIIVKAQGVQRIREEDFAMAKGVVDRRWRSECRDSARTTDGDYVCRVRTFGKYEDQLVLEFIYRDESLYRFERPVMSVRGGRAEPEVIEFSNDVEERSGEVMILHGCKEVSHGVLERSEVVMRMGIGGGGEVELTWDKECGYGEHEKLDYGWFGGEGVGDLSRPMSLKALGGSESVRTFGPRTLSTRVYLKIEEEGLSQRFERPVVNVRGLDGGVGVGVDVRGGHFGGVVLGKEYSVFDVMYGCVGKGVSVVSVSVGIRPFDRVYMQWRKDCGGGVARGLKVGTRAGLWGFGVVADVVRDGVAVGRYGNRGGNGSVGGYSGVRRRGRHGVRRFYVWGGWEEIGEIHAHVEDWRIASGEGRVVGNAGEVRKVFVWTRCKKKGATRVQVTMSVRDREAVEWWFDEMCSAERMRDGGGTAVTAELAMWCTMGMLVAVMAMWMRQTVSAALGVGAPAAAAKLQRRGGEPKVMARR